MLKLKLIKLGYTRNGSNSRTIKYLLEEPIVKGMLRDPQACQVIQWIGSSLLLALSTLWLSLLKLVECFTEFCPVFSNVQLIIALDCVCVFKKKREARIALEFSMVFSSPGSPFDDTDALVILLFSIQTISSSQHGPSFCAFMLHLMDIWLLGLAFSWSFFVFLWSQLKSILLFNLKQIVGKCLCLYTYT